MPKTNSGLVAYAKAQLGLPYWYGTYGQTSTIALYNNKKAQYPSNYTAKDFTSQLNKRVHDCVGLIKGYLWSDTPTSAPKYNRVQDKSAKGMFLSSTVRGEILTFPKKAGQLVYKARTQSNASTIHHVGVYDGNGYVYEAKGHAYGVVRTKFDSSWTHWSQCPYLIDDGATVPQNGVYPKYTGTSVSIVDGLKYVGEKDTSLAHRKKIAQVNGISAYIGTAEQNKKLIELLKRGSLLKA